MERRPLPSPSAGFVRGLIVAAIAFFVVAAILAGLLVEHVLILIPSLLLVGFFFSPSSGRRSASCAEQFDDAAFAQTFILHVVDLPRLRLLTRWCCPPASRSRRSTRFNPIFYMINLVR